MRYSSDESRSSVEPETKDPETVSQQTDPVEQTQSNNNQFIVEVRNLTKNVNVDHLKEIFGAYGKVLKAEHLVCPYRKILTGFGLITYEDSSAIEKAIDFLDGVRFFWNKISLLS